MSPHRVLVTCQVRGKPRSAGSTVNYHGPRTMELEPLDAREHAMWLREGFGCLKDESAIGPPDLGDH